MVRNSTRCLVGLAGISALIAGLVVTASAAGSPRSPIAFTESGLVIGTTTSGVNQFLGIPYAAPPLGPLRWTPPKPYGLFHGFVLQATQFGGDCTQPTASGPFGSENCLFLNVFTPQNVLADDLLEDHGRGLPVMVWIHGGGLVNGGAEIYDPTPMVKKGVIVVTMNYRLGYLGFFAQSALDSEGHPAGNYGLMDQQFAFKWVRQNIAGFGGDPDQVTIFGESAGGQSVYAHLASPTASRLFRGAISESGSTYEFQSYFDFIVSLTIGETIGTVFVPPGDNVAAGFGCSNPGETSSETSMCLRGLSASALVAVEPLGLFPFVDGTLLTQTPAQAFADGQFNRVPVIHGTNHDEWRAYVEGEYDFGVGPLTDAEYPAAVVALFGDSVDNPFVQFLVDTEYPLSNYPPPPGVVSAPLALGALGTDWAFACPARNADLLLSQYVPTYAYEFNDENAPQGPLPPGLTFPLGADHGAEIQYLFNFEAVLGPFTPAQQQLSDAMINYWTQFAKTGDPNSPDAPTWSPYTAGGSFESLLPPTPVPEPDASFDTDHKCSSFWDL
ncbi:carboxylesterase/lipase family protein [Candidatus Binatus sp.]|uniref:carboxylesterase/lipase family protein n=1 Tax=Candidatus Binatus sp. TaxID=2811406 RepID=UPI003C3246DD